MIPAILSVAGEIQNHINSTYDVMATRMFNIESHRFNIKQETIAKSAFWVAKKRYAQWIINDKGVNCDKLDVKGLDVRRSSFPPYFKTIMSEVLMDILKVENKVAVDNKILAYRKDISNQPITSLGRNSGVKGISKYTYKDQLLGAFTKGTPAHVKSCIAHNQLLTHYNLTTKYEPIKDGDKIKWVYLLHNNLGLESVAFTGYKDSDEILNIINTYIDYDQIWNSEIGKKLEQFYTSLGWELPNENLETASQFFSF